MRIHIVPCLSDNYAYLVAHEGGDAIVVDPSEAAPVRAALAQAGLSLVGIWLTHHHHDHVGGVADLVRAYPHLEVHASRYDHDHGRIPHVTRGVSEGDSIWFGSRRVRVLEVPGHTLGALAYLTEGALFSGDTLFSAGCGRLFEGTPAQMQHSLAKLRSLEAEIELYPGHEYAEKSLAFPSEIEPESAAVRAQREHVQALRAQGQPSAPTLLGTERATNPFLRWDAPDVIARARALGAASDAPAEVFAALRRARDTF